MTDSVEVSVDVAAPAHAVYDLVADLPSMGRWSPETVGAAWLGGANAAAPGARFRGRNRKGVARWSTVCEIVAADSGRELAWEVRAVGLPVARWGYRFEDTGTGCRVTESWQDRRGSVMKAIGVLGTGVRDRAEHNRRTMTETLQRLKTAAEGATPSGT